MNVRKGPSTDSAVTLKLNRGHELIEFTRQGEWINVGVARTGGKDGWVHRSLVGPNFPGGRTTPQSNPKITLFRDAVTVLNARFRRRTGIDLFTDVEDLGDGIVAVTATDTWLSAPLSDRQGNLSTLFDLWDGADGSGLPIMVRVVDQGGALVMQKAR